MTEPDLNIRQKSLSDIIDDKLKRKKFNIDDYESYGDDLYYNPINERWEDDGER